MPQPSRCFLQGLAIAPDMWSFQPEPRFTTPMRPIVLGNSAILASAITILCFSAPPLRACGWSRPGREALFTGNGLVDLDLNLNPTILGLSVLSLVRCRWSIF